MSKPAPRVQVELYTDGACSGNPGPGGWGVLLVSGGREKECYGGVAHTTNNRMELQAAIEGLGALKMPCAVTLYTDSRYVIQGMEEWIHGWIRNGWKTSAKKPVVNQDLWQALHALCQTHSVKWQWVKGHSGHPENERVDALARLGVEEVRQLEQKQGNVDKP